MGRQQRAKQGNRSLRDAAPELLVRQSLEVAAASAATATDAGSRAVIIDCHNHVGVDIGLYLRGEFPYAQHLETMVREGRELGVGRWIVFPMVINLSLNLRALREGRVEAGGAEERIPYAFENRRMMHEVYDLFPEQGRDTIPFAMFDPAREQQAQGEALRVLRRDYAFHGLKTQTTLIQAPITSLREGGRIFLELALEWDIPLIIHSSVIESDPWAQARDILDIAEENPGVRFCLAHSCRFDRTQLDRVAALPNTWFDCSAHGIHCELARQGSPIVAPVERRFESDYERPAQVLVDLARAYPGKLLWGSDSPFYSFVAKSEAGPLALLSSYAREASYLMALPEPVRWEISEANTLAFLGLPSDGGLTVEQIGRP